MNTIRGLLLVAFVISSLVACSANQVRLEAQLSPSANSGQYILKQSVIVQAPNARPSTLKADTTWLEVGSIEQGTVYRSKDQNVIVNSFNVHEGYIVLNGSKVVGYYLPVEKTFVESQAVFIELVATE